MLYKNVMHNEMLYKSFNNNEMLYKNVIIMKCYIRM